MAGSSLKDKLPNRALSGPELAEISRKEFRDMLVRDHAFAPNIAYKIVALTVEAKYELGIPHPAHVLHSRVRHCEVKNLHGPVLMKIAQDHLEHELRTNYVFQGSTAHKRSEITFTAIFHLGNPYEPEDGADVDCVLAGEAPLNPLPEKCVVVALERKVTLGNPNIDRINHDMPIIVQRSTAPVIQVPDNQLPGEPPTAVIGAPGVENLEFRYDKTQFPAPVAPVDTDVSQKISARLGVPQQSGG